jgi:hypothetical protein
MLVIITIFIYLPQSHQRMEEELRRNIRTFWKSAELVYHSKDTTSATLLYFKCWFVALDLMIFLHQKITPKDHTERFQILKTRYPPQYESLDREYAVYRQTYHLTISQPTCERIRSTVLKVLDEQGITL